MMILHDAGIDQGGFGAADGASQQLPVLREAAGFAMMIMVTPKMDWRELTLSSRSVQCLRVPNRAGYPSRPSISAQDPSLIHFFILSFSCCGKEKEERRQ